MKDIVKKAFLYALEVHGNQKRKDKKPYIYHPFSVAMELAVNGADDNLICAGLLHDTIEDGGITPNQLEQVFGSDVLQLVLFDTENKKLSWKERKDATIHALKKCDIRSAMLICADKLSNLKDVEEGLKNEGEEFWKNFKYGRKEQEWLYREYIDALQNLSEFKMYNEFKQIVENVFSKRRKELMQVSIEKNGNFAVAFVEGSINSSNAEEFGKKLAELPGEEETVILDITKLEYISSAGLRVILSLKKR